MAETRFYIPKKYGSYADGLAAVGLGKMLSLLFETNKVLMKDEGSYFSCMLSEDIDYEKMNILTLRNDPGYPYIQFKEDEENVPIKAYEYFKEQELYRANRKRKTVTKQQENLLKNVDAETSHVQMPRSDYLLMQSLRVLQALGTSNKLYKSLQEGKEEDLKKTIIQRLKMYSTLNQETPEKEPFKASVSAVQAYNPIIGKGVNKSKANSASVGSIPGKLVDWFEEWLRFIGAQVVLNAYPIKDDLKFMAIIPGQMEIGQLELMREEFLKRRYFSSIKIDVLILLQLVQLLVEHSEDYVKFRKSFGRKVPRDIISGLSTSYFKSLGTGKALVNNSFIAMPDWFPIDSKEDKELWNEVIDDHHKVLNTLDEDKQEEMQLLKYYRDFLSGSDWRSFFLYLASYAPIYMQRKHRKNYAVQHSLFILERLCTRVNTMYGEILNSQGFKEVAKALRESTVQEQYRKSQGIEQFPIKYGLFQELKRKAKFKDQVISAISEFINEYNAETARKREQQGPNYKGRQQVSLSAMYEFISLYDQHPKQYETITLLLIAAASCYDDTKKQ